MFRYPAKTLKGIPQTSLIIVFLFFHLVPIVTLFGAYITEFFLILLVSKEHACSHVDILHALALILDMIGEVRDWNHRRLR